MAIMSYSTEPRSGFVDLDRIETGDQVGLQRQISVDDASLFERLALLPTFEGPRGNRVVLRSDLDDSRHAYSQLRDSVPHDLFGNRSLSVMIGPTTRLDLPGVQSVSDPAYYAGLRNLFRLVRRGVSRDGPPARFDYFGAGRIETSSRLMVDEVQRQLAQAATVGASAAGQFAHSAYYMGSKRALGAFLAEAISSTFSTQGLVVDLMCGSGAASGAFSRLWPTVASDAQEFCRVLATVQGGGYQRSTAAVQIEDILGRARENTEALRKLIGDGMDEEDQLFHSNLNEGAVQRYKEFMEQWPTYPDGSSTASWNPLAEVEKRQCEPSVRPYCLFVAYYANVYFGLRQAIEIDGLRYAIQGLHRREDRAWALGALIASVSALGNTFGGHFAQPVRREVNLKSIGSLVEQRAASITHEFCARYLSLASESEATTHPVRTVQGPWQGALDSVQELTTAGQEITVYVDAPYTREEYSRYYHPLETLVSYQYPDSVGIGRVPSKTRGRRFQSEFFTRNGDRLINALSGVISSVLERGWTCAWSYSDRGGVSIPLVVQEVQRRTSCAVRSYAAPYRHNALGAQRAKLVTEHLVIYRPD